MVYYARRKRKRRSYPYSRPAKRRRVAYRMRRRRLWSLRKSFGEKFRHYVNLSTTQISSTGTSASLVDIDAGDGDGNRTGREIFVKGIKVRGVCTLADTTNWVRMLFMRKTTNQSLGFSSCITATTNQGVKDTTRFRYLKDKFIKLEAANTTQVFVKFWMPVNKVVVYSDGTGTNVIANDIGYFFFSDSGVVNHPTFDGQIIVYYKDF